MRFEEQSKKIIEKVKDYYIIEYKEVPLLTEKIAKMIEEITDNQCLECDFNPDNIRDNIPEPDYSKEDLD